MPEQCRGPRAAEGAGGYAQETRTPGGAGIGGETAETACADVVVGRRGSCAPGRCGIVVGWRVGSFCAPGISPAPSGRPGRRGFYAKRIPASIQQIGRANLALYKSLSPEQWKHYGMHSSAAGASSISSLTRGPRRESSQQIERILAPKDGLTTPKVRKAIFQPPDWERVFSRHQSATQRDAAIGR